MAQTITIVDARNPGTTQTYTVDTAIDDGDDGVLTSPEAQEAFRHATADAASGGLGIPADQVILRVGSSDYREGDISGLPSLPTGTTTTEPYHRGLWLGGAFRHDWFTSQDAGDQDGVPAHEGDGNMFVFTFRAPFTETSPFFFEGALGLGALSLSGSVPGPNDTTLTSNLDSTFTTTLDLAVGVYPLNNVDYLRHLYVMGMVRARLALGLSTPSDNFAEVPAARPDFACPEGMGTVECNILRGQYDAADPATTQEVNLNNSGLYNPDNGLVNDAHGGIGAGWGVGVAVGYTIASPLDGLWSGFNYVLPALDVRAGYMYEELTLWPGRGGSFTLDNHVAMLQLGIPWDLTSSGSRPVIEPHRGTPDFNGGSLRGTTTDLLAGPNLNSVYATSSAVSGPIPEGSVIQILDGATVEATVNVSHETYSQALEGTNPISFGLADAGKSFTVRLRADGHDYNLGTLTVSAEQIASIAGLTPQTVVAGSLPVLTLNGSGAQFPANATVILKMTGQADISIPVGASPVNQLKITVGTAL